MKLEGLRELEDKLRALGEKDGARALRTAVLAAGKVILKRARQNAEQLPTGSGAYALSLGVRFVRAAGADDTVPIGRRFVAQIGPRAKLPAALTLYNAAYRRRARGIFYGHLIERGFQHRSGVPVAARPVLLPAIRQTQAAAIEKFRVTLGRAIDRITKKRQRAAQG